MKKSEYRKFASFDDNISVLFDFKLNVNISFSCVVNVKPKSDNDFVFLQFLIFSKYFGSGIKSFSKRLFDESVIFI